VDVQRLAELVGNLRKIASLTPTEARKAGWLNLSNENDLRQLPPVVNLGDIKVPRERLRQFALAEVRYIEKEVLPTELPVIRRRDLA